MPTPPSTSAATSTSTATTASEPASSSKSSDSSPGSAPSPGSVSVSARITCTVTAEAELVFSLAVADGTPVSTERLDCTLDGRSIELDEVAMDHGGRFHVARQVPPGELVLDYAATVDRSGAAPEVTTADTVQYIRPSRYCEVDRLGVSANRLFAGLADRELVDAVVTWVNDNTLYVSGSSGTDDGAMSTLLTGQGVCRDFAHLVVTLLRASGVPARMVSVYAPGLSPMDFHAVVEVALDGRWEVVDATRLAPRASMVRIATGRDAADTAFLTVRSGRVDFGSLTVTAVANGDLPVDDPAASVHL